MYELIKKEREFEIVSFTPEILEETITTQIPENTRQDYSCNFQILQIWNSNQR